MAATKLIFNISNSFKKVVKYWLIIFFHFSIFNVPNLNLNKIRVYLNAPKKFANELTIFIPHHCTSRKSIYIYLKAVANICSYLEFKSSLKNFQNSICIFYCLYHARLHLRLFIVTKINNKVKKINFLSHFSRLSFPFL